MSETEMKTIPTFNEDIEEGTTMRSSSDESMMVQQSNQSLQQKKENCDNTSSSFSFENLQKYLLSQDRIQALLDCDANLLTYNPQSFFLGWNLSLIWRFRGRNVPFLLGPLLAFVVWDLMWATLFYTKTIRLTGSNQSFLVGSDSDGESSTLLNLVAPLLTPVSFLLVFRLGRAAIRFWDARAATGKIVEMVRALSSTAMAATRTTATGRDDSSDLVEFMSWLAIFPIVVKNFLRPSSGKQKQITKCRRRAELGKLVSSEEMANHILSRDSDGPIFVLGRLRTLSIQILNNNDNASLVPMMYRQLNSQLDTITGAWGALERINATPLPLVYVLHLRTFLLVYLGLWHFEVLATSAASQQQQGLDDDIVSFYFAPIGPLLAATWALLGIEAAAVECERPFSWNSNHLALGQMCVTIARNVASTCRDMMMIGPRLLANKMD